MIHLEHVLSIWNMCMKRGVVWWTGSTRPKRPTSPHVCDCLQHTISEGKKCSIPSSSFLLWGWCFWNRDGLLEVIILSKKSQDSKPQISNHMPICLMSMSCNWIFVSHSLLTYTAFICNATPPSQKKRNIIWRWNWALMLQVLFSTSTNFIRNLCKSPWITIACV